jgi:hypothetical protein
MAAQIGHQEGDGAPLAHRLSGQGGREARAEVAGLIGTFGRLPDEGATTAARGDAERARGRGPEAARSASISASTRR